MTNERYSLRAVSCSLVLFLSVFIGAGNVIAGSAAAPVAVPEEDTVRLNIEQKTPRGPAWPVGWTFKCDKPDAIPRGQPFQATLAVTPLLFDVEAIEIKAGTGGGNLKIVAGDTVWKGALKKGEARTFRFTLLAPDEGYNGKVCLLLKSLSFYRQLRAYVSSQKEGAYASKDAKVFMLNRIDEMEKDYPVYDEGFGAEITVKAQEGQ